MPVVFFLIVGASFCVALIAAWFLVSPFLELETAPLKNSALENSVRNMDRLSEQRDALLEQLAELENEFQSGNLANEEFETTRAELVAEIGRVIAQIEKDTGAEINVHARAAERQ